MSNNKIVIALPNKGRLSSETINFLEKCALYVRRDNERQYQAKMEGGPQDVEVIFQRARDIPQIVDEGSVDLGITGFDIFCEMGGESKGNSIPVFPNRREKPAIMSLPYGKCVLVLAVPDHWVDVSSISDLAELSIVRKKQGKMLRVATEFPNLAQNYLFSKGVSFFEIIEVSGATESTPRMGSADLIVDLKSSGVTLAENRLKEIAGGEILESGACLIASKKRLKGTSDEMLQRRKLAQQIIDRIEAHIKARKFRLITANIEGDNEDYLRMELKRDVDGNALDVNDLKLLGQEGPTVADVLHLQNGKKHIYSVSIQVESKYLERVIGILRAKTGKNILVTPISFVYDNEPEAYKALENKLTE